MSDTTSRGTSVSVSLEGPLDFDTVPDHRRNLLKALRKVVSPTMELDFSRVSRADTSGIAMLVELNRVAVSMGGRVSLTGMNEQVLRMMRLARLDRIFGLDEVEGVEPGS